MNIRLYKLKDYKEIGQAGRRKNEPKRTQFERQNTEFMRQKTIEIEKQSQLKFLAGKVSLS
jgi:hypothetical protein